MTTRLAPELINRARLDKFSYPQLARLSNSMHGIGNWTSTCRLGDLLPSLNISRGAFAFLSRDLNDVYTCCVLTVWAVLRAVLLGFKKNLTVKVWETLPYLEGCRPSAHQVI